MNAQTTSLNIFLVENHEDTLKYMRMYLETLGHAVVVARDVSSALKEIPTLPVDLLISDIGLPDGTGWDLLKQLRSEHPVFAVAMSGFGMNADRAKSREAGFRHHLIKPFMPDELDPILSEALAQKST